jgi:hypothetical protein
MMKYDAKLSEPLRKIVREQGFDPNADVVPSAAGMPLESVLSPAEFRRHSRNVLRNARGKTKQQKS